MAGAWCVVLPGGRVFCPFHALNASCSPPCAESVPLLCLQSDQLRTVLGPFGVLVFQAGPLGRLLVFLWWWWLVFLVCPFGRLLCVVQLVVASAAHDCDFAQLSLPFAGGVSGVWQLNAVIAACAVQVMCSSTNTEGIGFSSRTGAKCV